MALYYIPEFTAPRDRLKFQAQIEQTWRDSGLRPVTYPKNYLLRAFALFSRFISFHRGDIVFFIHPLYSRTSRLLLRFARRKGCRTVCLVSDINSLRGEPLSFEKETNYWKTVDGFIFQNQTMKELVESRIGRKPSVLLQLFDLLFDPPEVTRSASNQVVFAGNAAKAPFLKDLSRVSGVGWRVYSAELPASNGVTVTRLEDEISDRRLLEGSYGLVWEGDSIDNLSGPGGEYLKLVTPLKLSNYLLQSLPVITHRDAAVAGFVKENGIGICVASLHEIPGALARVSEADYGTMFQNCRRFAENLSRGHYSSSATRAILDRLQGQRTQSS